MKFKEIAMEYYKKFNEMPPELTTLDIENAEYLEVLKEAIKNGEKLTRNDLGKIFMPDNSATY